MKYEIIAQDELDILTRKEGANQRSFKDPIEIRIQITIERKKLESIIDKITKVLLKF